jgi:hypothetical protein
MWGDKEYQESEAYWQAQARFEKLERMKNKGWGEKPPKIEENKMKEDIEALERGLKFFEALKESQPPSVADLIERLDQKYGNPYAKDCTLIQEAIKMLRIQEEEIRALIRDVRDLSREQERND